MNTDLIIAIIFFIIGLIPTYYFYKKSIRIKEPIYSIKSVNVISDYASTYPNLTVSYIGEKVKSFTVSKVLFFNRGAIALDRDDLAPLNPLRIEVSSGKILDATVLQVNNPSSDFTVDLNRAFQLFMIDFDYLNQHQGAVIEVIHTGLSSRDIDVVGDMKDVKKLGRLSPLSMRIAPQSNLKRAIGNIALLLLSLLTLTTLIVTAYEFFRSGINGFISYLFPTTLLLIALLLILAMSYSILFPRTVIPKGLEKFHE